MATVIDTVTKDNRTILVYDNGMERDADSGKMVRPPSAALITPEKSIEYQRKKQELKQAAVLRGAAKVLERTGDWVAPTDMDVVEAVSEAIMENAMNPDSRKQIDAARFLMVEAGFSSRENTSATPPAGTVSLDRDALMALLDAIEERKRQAVDAARAIEGTAE